MADVYRFILISRPGRAETGAGYQGCSPNTTQACDPRGFDGTDALQQAITYAYSHNEIPVQVYSQQEAWDMLSGKMAITSDRVLSSSSLSSLFGNMDMTTMLLLALGAIFLVPQLLKKKKSS